MENTFTTAVDVVTGFLGAGKTTLIGRYTAWLKARGEKFVVIENEFGQAGVDGRLLKHWGVDVREISGGCICCTLKVTMHELLLSLAGKAHRVIVEPSGVFSGDDLLDILDSPDISGRVTPGFWTAVADPFSLNALRPRDAQVLRDEIMAAGSVVFSRAQQADAEALGRAEAYLGGLLPVGAEPPAFFAKPWTGAYDEELFPALRGAGLIRRAHERTGADHQTLFQSASLRPRAAFRTPELEKGLLRLLKGEAGALVRVKGMVRAAEGGALLVNAAPGGVWVERAPGENYEPMLNFIGSGLDRKKIRAILEEYTDEHSGIG